MGALSDSGFFNKYSTSPCNKLMSWTEVLETYGVNAAMASVDSLLCRVIMLLKPVVWSR